jgi:hypothetical protein
MIMPPRRHDSLWVPTPESIERHRVRLGYGWDAALNLAYKHDTVKLSAYLRRPDLPLDQDKREQLADLLDRVVHRRQRGRGGRKPGRIPPANPDAITTYHVVAWTRDRLDRIRRRNGGKLPWGANEAALTHVCQRLADEGEPFEVNEQQALKMLRRGRR